MSEETRVLPSEALFGFAGWLTTRDKPVIMSAKHDAGVVASLVDEYIAKQGFEEPRDKEYPKNLISMK